jgi:Zn-dependent peptidase ImmA (M78 family)/transcriptional regulator with XRE-family HTH domain
MNPNRFKLAREINGLTQTELARAVEVATGRRVAQSTIAEIEGARLVPSTPLATAIGEATGFPLEFLEQSESTDFPSGTLVLFRSKAQVSAREEAQAYRNAQLVGEITGKLARRINPIACTIPQLSESSPVEAARLTRAALGLSPDRPIQNLIRTLEKAGVVVLALPFERDPVDAFSLWMGLRDPRDQVPCIALLKDAPADRQRWNVAHELGHLVLHRAARVGTAVMEDEANRFAGELLTPSEAMQSELVPPVTMVTLRDMKVRWKVSMRSLVNRAAEVGAINQRQRTYLFMKISSLFGGKSEPAYFTTERPRGLRQMFEMVYGIPIDFEEAAYDLKLSPERLRQIVELYQGAHTAHSPTNMVDFRPSNSVPE